MRLAAASTHSTVAQTLVMLHPSARSSRNLQFQLVVDASPRSTTVVWDIRSGRPSTMARERPIGSIRRRSRARRANRDSVTGEPWYRQRTTPNLLRPVRQLALLAFPLVGLAFLALSLFLVYGDN